MCQMLWGYMKICPLMPYPIELYQSYQEIIDVKTALEMPGAFQKGPLKLFKVPRCKKKKKKRKVHC